MQLSRKRTGPLAFASMGGWALLRAGFGAARAINLIAHHPGCAPGLRIPPNSHDPHGRRDMAEACRPRIDQGLVAMTR
jgi:hypothetical protein